MINRFCDQIVRFRIIFILLVVVLTGFFAYRSMSLVLYDDPNKWPPNNEPNVQINNLMQDEFGGSNLVTIQVTVKEGDIFNPETLHIVKRITDKLSLIWGVIPYNLTSIGAIRVRYLRGTDDFLDNTPLMETVPTDAEGMERLKYGIYHNPTIYGTIVSEDAKSTIITADFRTSQPSELEAALPTTDPVAIYKEVMTIIEAEDDDNHVINAVGTPIIIGWVNSEGLPYVGIALLVFVIGIIIVLYFSLKKVRAVVLSLLLGLIAIIWAFGLFNLIFGNVLQSSSAFIAPFIIVAAVTCHTVQFFRRFLDEEYYPGVHPNTALKITVNALSRPIVISLITDSTAFLVLAFVPFDNIAVLGRTTALGLISTIFCLYFFTIPLVSLFAGRPKQRVAPQDVKEGWTEKIINDSVRRLIMPTRFRWVVLGCLMILLIVSCIGITRIRPGQDNTYAIHNYITRSWKNNPIYLMEMDFKKKFKGIYPLSVMIKTKEERGLLEPKILKKIDAFGAYLESIPGVAGTIHLPVYYKLMHRFMNAEDPAYWAISDNKRVIATYHNLYMSQEPGSFDGAVDYDIQRSPLYAYVEDTNYDTVTRVFNAARDYAEDQFNDDNVIAMVGGGSIGIANAFNTNIGKWLIISTVLSAFASFLVMLALIRSAVGSILLLLPLFVGTLIWLFVVYLLGIEINSNTTAGMAIAMGVGIDAEVYFLFRFREEFGKVTTDFREALVSAFTKIRKGLIFSHFALIIGLGILVPIPLYIGYVGFTMALIILICFVVSFTLSPIIWSVLKPQFLFTSENKKMLEESPCSADDQVECRKAGC